MKFAFTLCFAFLFFSGGLLYAQVPLVGSPVQIDIGLGGGVSVPNGTFSDKNNSGYHYGAKARLRGLLPCNFVASCCLNRLPNKAGNESDDAVMVGVGIEIPVPTLIVNPYFGFDAMWNRLGNTAPGSEKFSRTGLGLGAGVDFSIPGLGSFDTSIKYQIFNLFGKEGSEETLSQIAGNVSLFFSLF